MHTPIDEPQQIQLKVFRTGARIEYLRLTPHTPKKKQQQKQPKQQPLNVQRFYSFSVCLFHNISNKQKTKNQSQQIVFPQ